MAFVSDKHKLVFIHSPKTGGTSICDHLARAHGSVLRGGAQEFAHRGIGGDVPAAHRPNGITVHDRLDEVRGKYPQASDYHSFCVVRNPWARIFSFYQHKLRRGDKDLPLGKSFSDIFRVSNCLLLQPQTYWCLDVDTVLHFEQLGDEYGAFIHEFGLPAGLRQLNRTTKPDDYRAYYDVYSHRIVMEFYRYEIERFGYSF